jgi:hypothetical protein
MYSCAADQKQIGFDKPPPPKITVLAVWHGDQAALALFHIKAVWSDLVRHCIPGCCLLNAGLAAAATLLHPVHDLFTRP